MVKRWLPLPIMDSQRIAAIRLSQCLILKHWQNSHSEGVYKWERSLRLVEVGGRGAGGLNRPIFRRMRFSGLECAEGFFYIRGYPGIPFFLSRPPSLPDFALEERLREPNYGGDTMPTLLCYKSRQDTSMSRSNLQLT